MQTLPPRAMRPLCLAPSLTPSLPASHSRYLCFLRVSFPIFHNCKSRPNFQTISPKVPSLTVRSCASISAKPSSELRKKRAGSESDEKLRALRELFSKPGIGIDAYIIPSQDAHQVLNWFNILASIVFSSFLLYLFLLIFIILCES